MKRNATHLTGSLILLGVVFVTSGAMGDTLLEGRFGVTPLLDTLDTRFDQHHNATSYHFLAGSLIPTKNTSTADYIIDDWWGEWSDTTLGSYQSWSYAGQGPGTYPAAEEPYDVEAIYFDNDESYLYIAIVTSFVPPPGRQEDRASGTTLVVSGDLGLDVGALGHNTPAGDGFQYDFGVDITDDVRPSSTSSNASATGPGTEKLYRTSNGDWYLGTAANATPAGGELTNFDPDAAGSTAVELGDVIVDYYEYTFADGLEEGFHPTYVIEATIPRSLLPKMQDGDLIGISYVEGCRNDGNDSAAIVRLDGSVPEPATLGLLVGGALGLLGRRRYRN
jgi:hypothetical protein